MKNWILIFSKGVEAPALQMKRAQFSVRIVGDREVEVNGLLCNCKNFCPVTSKGTGGGTWGSGI